MQRFTLLALFFVSTAQASTFHWEYNTQPWCDASNSCCPDTPPGSQSPIDIVFADVEDASGELNSPSLTFSANYFTEYLSGRMANNGHTIVFTPSETEPELSITGGPLGNETYVLAQYHFHWGSRNKIGSEHAYNGRRYVMEVHFVHYKSEYGSVGGALGNDDGLAVIGIMFEQTKLFTGQPAMGARLPHFLNSADMAPMIAGRSIQAHVTLSDLFDNVPDLTDYVTYQGSLTTPPCSEVVTWINILSPVGIHNTKMGIFRKYRDLTNNYRELQDKTGRTLKRSISLP